VVHIGLLRLCCHTERYRRSFLPAAKAYDCFKKGGDTGTIFKVSAANIREFKRNICSAMDEKHFGCWRKLEFLPGQSWRVRVCHYLVTLVLEGSLIKHLRGEKGGGKV